jgi:hypothetical protein
MPARIAAGNLSRASHRDVGFEGFQGFEQALYFPDAALTSITTD